MEDANDINNLLILKILKNSSFTERQMQIIYNIKSGQKRPMNLSSGAFYREAKQSKDKIKKNLYSLLLMQILGIIDKEQIFAFLSVIDRLNLATDNHNINHNKEASSVINVIEQLITKMINM